MYCVRNIIYFICIIILSISCSNIEEAPALQAPSSAALSTTVVGGPNRISANSPKRIFGIYAIAGGTNKSYNNCPYRNDSWTTTDPLSGNLTPNTDEVIVYPIDNTPLTFYAYYPYTNNIEKISDSLFVYRVDWSKQDESVDLLVAESKSGKAEEPNVNLEFKHKFSKIILNVTVNSEFTDLSDEDLENMTVSAEGMNFNTTCNIFDGTIYPGSEINDDRGIINFKKNEVGKYEAIVCPGVIPNINSEISFILGGRVLKWTLPTIKDKNKPETYESGNCYIYNLRLNGNSIIEAKLEAIFHDWNTVNEGDIPLGPNDLIK